MKELDFDELDRAVNSLMGSASKFDPIEEPLEIKSTLSPTPGLSAPPLAEPTDVTAASSSEPVATPLKVNTPQASLTPALRKSGRFMEMVNTPANAKPRTSTPKAPSREGLTITPRSETETDTATLAPKAVSEQPKSPQPSSTDMPDPIDVSMMNTTEDEDVTAPTAALTATGVSESPFLADAKVDKRPLNSSESSELEVPFEKTSDSILLTTSSVDPNAKVEDEPPQTPTAPELDSDLVAIESGSRVSDVPATQADNSHEAEKEVATPSAQLGATSIAQQYTSQPSSGDKSHAAIYDSSQYPEPVSHPAKKKSGWLWVLWVLLLLGIGAGSAILLYSLGIIP